MTDDEFKLMNALAMTLDFVFETQSLVGEAQEEIMAQADDFEADIEVDIPFINEYFVFTTSCSLAITSDSDAWSKVENNKMDSVYIKVFLNIMSYLLV